MKWASGGSDEVCPSVYGETGRTKQSMQYYYDEHDDSYPLGSLQ